MCCGGAGPGGFRGATGCKPRAVFGFELFTPFDDIGTGALRRGFVSISVGWAGCI